MKKLSNYAVLVNSQIEADQAIKFFRLASHRPLCNTISFGQYVGMYLGKVNRGNMLMSTEISIPFSDIKLLADTPSRLKAYSKVFGMLQITLTQAHKDKAAGYWDNDNCILATALKEQFPNKAIFVSGFWVTIDNEKWNMSHRDSYSVSEVANNRQPLPLTITLTKE